MSELRLPVSGGVTLTGERFGDPAAPPVLLLHGGGQTRHAWRGTGEQLAARGWCVLTVDQRGHGDSDWASDGDYSLDAFAADIRVLALGCGRAPVVVGASLGGASALLAIGEPQAPLARALVLVDVGPRIDMGGARRIVDFMSARPEGFASLEEAADAVAAYLPHRARPTDLSGLERNLRRRGDRWVWHWDPRILDEARMLVFKDGTRLDAATTRLSIPTLLVRGALSDVMPADAVAHFRALAPHAETADVGDAAHMVAGDRNDRFNDAVVAFLSRL